VETVTDTENNRSSAATVDALAKTIWLAGFERAFSRTPTDPWENQAESAKAPHIYVARKVIEAGFVNAAQAAPEPIDYGTELLRWSNIEIALRKAFPVLDATGPEIDSWPELIAALAAQPPAAPVETLNDQAREHPRYDNPRDPFAAPDRCSAEKEEALGYAQRLATALWEKHWKADAPEWKPLPELIGVLTQIDNMTVGLGRVSGPQESR
jgi:hypothetical protein